VTSCSFVRFFTPKRCMMENEDDANERRYQFEKRHGQPCCVESKVLLPNFVKNYMYQGLRHTRSARSCPEGLERDVRQIVVRSILFGPWWASAVGFTVHVFKGKLQYLYVCHFYNNDQWLTILECTFLLYQPIRNVTYKSPQYFAQYYYITHLFCILRLLYHPFEPCSAGHATVSRRQWYPVAY
jgi:hypothetical protein